MTPSRVLRSCTGALVVVVADLVLVVWVVTGMTGSALPTGVLATGPPPAPSGVPAGTTPTPDVSLPATPTTAEPGVPPVTAPVVPSPRRAARPARSAPRATGPAAIPSPRRPVPTTSTPVTVPSAPSAEVRPPPAQALGVPTANVAPDPDFLHQCASTTYDDSSSCTSAALDAIDNARSAEGLGAMQLPGNWAALTPAEQLFVATDLERTARGLAPVSAMATALDTEAGRSAVAGGDPSPPTGLPFRWWVGNWAGAVGNPLEAVYYWMYDDGPGSPNVACTTSDTSGCWGHRLNILVTLACTPCITGAAWGATASGTPSAAEVIIGSAGSWTLDFTWSQELAYLP